MNNLKVNTDAETSKAIIWFAGVALAGVISFTVERALLHYIELRKQPIRLYS